LIAEEWGHKYIATDRDRPGLDFLLLLPEIPPGAVRFVTPVSTPEERPSTD